MRRNYAVAGCVQDIGSLVASGEVWDAILDALADRFGLSQNIDQLVHKDLYVTEAIRHAVVPSMECPETLVIFKGGTSLAKAYPILHRFSEDVDVNIVPPPDQQFGDSRRRRVRRELHTRLETGLALEMDHDRRRHQPRNHNNPLPAHFDTPRHRSRRGGVWRSACRNEHPAASLQARTAAVQ